MDSCKCCIHNSDKKHELIVNVSKEPSYIPFYVMQAGNYVNGKVAKKCHMF